MPAEQNNGHPQFASDVYAVGMLAIQALTGLFPHELPTDAQTGEAIWRDRVRVGDRLAQVLDKMIRYDYRQRYRSATDALAAVQELKSAIASTIISPLPAPRSSWTKSQIIAMIALFVGIVSGIATVIKVPEVREWKLLNMLVGSDFHTRVAPAALETGADAARMSRSFIRSSCNSLGLGWKLHKRDLESMVYVGFGGWRNAIKSATSRCASRGKAVNCCQIVSGSIVLCSLIIDNSLYFYDNAS